MGILRCHVLFILLNVMADVRHLLFDRMSKGNAMKELEST